MCYLSSFSSQTQSKIFYFSKNNNNLKKRFVCISIHYDTYKNVLKVWFNTLKNRLSALKRLLDMVRVVAMCYSHQYTFLSSSVDYIERFSSLFMLVLKCVLLCDRNDGWSGSHCTKTCSCCNQNDFSKIYHRIQRKSLSGLD